MHVQLPHLVAERGDIDLVAAGQRLEMFADRDGLGGQHRLVERRQVVDFDGSGALRDENEPGKPAVVHQQQTAQAEIGDGKRVGLEGRIEAELFHLATISVFCALATCFWPPEIPTENPCQSCQLHRFSPWRQRSRPARGAKSASPSTNCCLTCNRCARASCGSALPRLQSQGHRRYR